MNCTDFKQRLDDHLDGQLGRQAMEAMERHTDACDRCKAELIAAHSLMRNLRALPIPPASPGFARRALAASSGYTRTIQRRWAAAAAVALLLTGSWAGLMVGHQASTPLDGITLALHEERTVDLAFNVPQAIRGGTLVMELPAGVELAGYPDQRQLTWQTDLQQGTNLLSLPVRAREGRGGELVARIEHGGKSKAFRLRLEIQAANHTRRLTPDRHVYWSKDPTTTNPFEEMKS
ncbi:anti-sigma factor family protein [Thiohalomonas denitrificans]|uniref:anti-sigma factor family protein n=1 Tax=Thiohalomonas denitrificans TaxID=415747 RepID=UPI0026EBFB1B|nr:zf-HC2 domain-containing protein [Thiohalomonas denitrificans]